MMYVWGWAEDITKEANITDAPTQLVTFYEK